MGLAATFSREDARRNGEVIGGDARALGQDIVLEPFLNLVRDFSFARAYNMYGEDPLVVGQIGAAVVSGIQSRGVMSAAKHYTAFDGGTDVVVDPQTRRAWIYRRGGLHEVRDGVLRTTNPDIEIPLADVFPE